MVSLPLFTPSLADGPLLEKLFVVRESSVDSEIARIQDAATTGRLAHVLYTGPRGAGKTHLIALTHYRATQLAGYGSAFTMAWLSEEPWGIFTYDDFIARVAAAKEHPDVGLTVVFAESLEKILNQIGPEGQRSLRARIEQDADLLLVASAQRLTEDLTEQPSPFYGFFQTIELTPFTLDEALHMLQRAAQVGGDEALESRLKDRDVYAKLNAIRQIAGGQPRLWALLSAGLTAKDLNDIVPLVLTRFDDVTPYYQEQLSSLSRTELRIVLACVAADHAMTVRQISDASGIDAKTVASTVRRLMPQWLTVYKGEFIKHVDKRLTYYQISEPLARVSLQIKATRGWPVQLLVNFLSMWYSQSEISRGMNDVAIAVLPEIEEQARTIDSALALLQHREDATKVLDLAVPLVSLLESELEAKPVGLLRIELALLAVRAGGDPAWLARAMDAFSGVTENQTRLAQVCVAAIRTLTGDEATGTSALRLALEYGGVLTPDEWNVIAMTVKHPTHEMSVNNRDIWLSFAVASESDGHSTVKHLN